MLDIKQLLTAFVLQENDVAVAILELQRMCNKSTDKLEKIQLILTLPVVAKTRAGQRG